MIRRASYLKLMNLLIISAFLLGSSGGNCYAESGASFISYDVSLTRIIWWLVARPLYWLATASFNELVVRLVLVIFLINFFRFEHSFWGALSKTLWFPRWLGLIITALVVFLFIYKMFALMLA